MQTSSLRGTGRDQGWYRIPGAGAAKAGGRSGGGEV